MKISLARFRSAAIGVMLIAAMAGPRRGAAATNTVSNTSGGYVAGSLPLVVRDSPSGDTIVFATNVTGTITLTSGALVISNKTLTILGPGANVLAISGNNASRVFHTTSGATASISGLSIVNGGGFNGGGVMNISSSTLTLSNCVISGNSGTNNHGAGILNYANAVLVNCTITNNTTPTSGYAGGGIYTGGTMTAVNCTISGNSAPGGGGIYANSDTAAFNNCTISGNQTTGDGGGIYIYSASVALTNCTIASNTGRRGGAMHLHDIYYSPNATIRSCTIVGNGLAGVTTNGGGIYNLGTVDIGDSILAGNTATTRPDYSGLVASAGFNLVGNTSGSAGFGSTGDQLDLAPLLGPLQNNGGPTHTMAPLPGSPAIDQGKSFGLAADQRGRPRPFDHVGIPNALGGDGSDIGAVEVNPGTLVVLNTNDNGGGSLRQAILDASPGDNDVITFTAGLSGTITLTNGELLIGKSLSISGPGAKVIAVSGNSSSRVFGVTNGIVNISGLTIREGKALGTTGNPGQTVSGGGILSAAQVTLTLTDCVISNCAAIGGAGSRGIGSVGNGRNGGSAYGGAIFNQGGLTLDRCWVVGNQARGGGGGDGGITSGTGGNGGNGTGGGIYSEFANLVIRASTLNANQAIYGSGGFGLSGSGANGTALAAGLDNYSGTVTLINSTVVSNVVTGAGTGIGGGIYSALGPVALLGCTVVNNHGESAGGGISGGGSITNTIIAGNTAGSSPNVSGSFTSGGYNLIGIIDGGSGFGATGDQLNISPLLGPLRDNGGSTPTMSPLSNSPAIDKGKSFGLITDQRGAPRPFDFAAPPNAGGGDGSDIGAFELGSPILNIQMFTTAAILSWPFYYGDFTLQSVTNVIASNSWANVAGTPAVVANQYVLTNGPISGNKFYRLKGN